VVARAREHKDDDDDDADGGEADSPGANSPAATKVDKQVATMMAWVSSNAFKSIFLRLITRESHKHEIIFRTNPIYGSLSLFSCRNRELCFSSSLEEAQRVSEDAFTAMICTEKKY
jgi:hypothetical protein